MKKLFLTGLLLCGLFVAQHSYAYTQDAANTGSAVPASQNNMMMNAPNASANQMAVDGQMSGEQYWSHDGRRWNQGEYAAPEGCCDQPREDHPCGDVSTGDCWCKYCHYEPCYYYTKRCVTENKYCTKKCCRQVPQYYEVQRCRYVPQYYTETCCKYCPEYYDVQECIPCQKWVCDRHCKYVPRYYWKHVCGQPDCKTPCPR